MPDSPRDLPGSLGTTEIRLANRPRPYRHYFIDSYDERQDIAGTDVRAEPQRARIREWKIDDWTGGFGYPIWSQETPNRYNTARNVCPEFRTINYSGLVLGPEISTANDDSPTTWTPSATSAGTLWAGQDHNQQGPSVYGFKTRAIHPWLPGSGAFDATAVTAGPVSGEPSALADPEDGFLYVMMASTNDIYQVEEGTPTNILHFDQSAASSPKFGTAAGVTMTAFRGEVYVLNEPGDLYLLDRSTTNTVTKVVDAFYTGGLIQGSYLHRLTTSDVGPMWFQPTPNGVDVWEYNVAEDSASIIHRIGERGIRPEGIVFAGGFTFISYARGSVYGASPNVYIHYFRGGQSGTLGPIVENQEAFTVFMAEPIQGRFLPVTVNELASPDEPLQLFVYDLAEGAWHHWADGALGTSTHSAIYQRPHVIGDDILLPASSAAGTYRVEVAEMDKYATIASTDAYLDTGRYDFDMPGTLKALTEITVLTEPLPANTTVEIQYSLDGGAWQDNSLDITTDNITITTFDLTAQNDTFYELELRILLNSSSSSATPTVRAVTTRALPVGVQEYWDIEVDLNDASFQVSGDLTHTTDMISALVALKTNKQAVTFTNPWEVDRFKGAADQTDTVYVVSVQVPDAHGPDDQMYASVRLVKAALS